MVQVFGLEFGKEDKMHITEDEIRLSPPVALACFVGYIVIVVLGSLSIYFNYILPWWMGL